MKAETFVQLLTPVFLAQIPVRRSLLFRLHYTKLVYKRTREMEQLGMMCGVMWAQRHQSGRRSSLKGCAVFLNLPQPLTRPQIYMSFMAHYSRTSEPKGALSVTDTSVSPQKLAAMDCKGEGWALDKLLFHSLVPRKCHRLLPTCSGSTNTSNWLQIHKTSQEAQIFPWQNSSDRTIKVFVCPNTPSTIPTAHPQIPV